MGLEHSVVNMYLFPSALLMGSKFSISGCAKRSLG